MNKVLIIGGNGLLGSTLVSCFLKKELKVGILSRSVNSEFKNKVSIHQKDILEYKGLEDIFSKYDIIINCIGQITNPTGLCLKLNTIGIDNIINAIKATGKRLIHISTVSVYGTANEVDESSNLNPETAYGAMKCFSEYQIKSKLNNYAILRVSNLFGNNQNKGILAYILKVFLAKEKKLYFNNNGKLKRYYLNVDDLSEIIYIIIEKNLTETYNIIGNDFLDIKELICVVEETLNYSFEVIYENKEPNENIQLIKCEKIKNKINNFNYKSIVDYLKGMKNVIN